MNATPEDTDDAYDQPSKSQLKRDSAALQDLAAELAGLPSAQLHSLSLPDNILSAVCEAAGMPARGARKRLLKYIGGLLRAVDAGPIQENLAKLHNQSVHSARQHHTIERWRERLLSEDRQALTDLLANYSAADSQQLRQLIRNAKKEIQAGKPPKSSRQLYRNLKEILGDDVESG